LGLENSIEDRFHPSMMWTTKPQNSLGYIINWWWIVVLFGVPRSVW
jgi:hypothetical protein